MAEFEVAEPIQNTPFEEPQRHWYIAEGQDAELRDGRRRGVVFPPRNQRNEWDLGDGTLARSSEYPSGYDLLLVNRIREQVKAWREGDYPGATRTTLELLEWWRRAGRQRPLFFAQREAAETVIFLNEARADFRQGIVLPREELGPDREAEGYKGFLRYACKMATGSGKTTVMGMIAAWSILNKVHDRGNARYSDVVLVICPNVTIRGRLAELDPELGPASLYWTSDLVPPHLRDDLKKGRVLVRNWHVFHPQAVQVQGTSAKVLKAGVRKEVAETITIGAKSTTARGSRYLAPDDLQRQVAAGLLEVRDEERDREGNLKKVKVLATRYVKSDTAMVNDVLGREVGGKQNILVINDEAHHAYRIKREEHDLEEEELFGEVEDADDFFKEATVWIDGLDRINKLRGINFCLDLSATPYFLGRVGQDTNKPFPWVVSDFGLMEAIESGLTKIPQLAVRDTTGEERAKYFNIWEWILPKLTPAERGGKRANPKPEAILKYAHHPIAILAAQWEEVLKEREGKGDDPRPPVFILVCKNTALAKVIYSWIADSEPPTGIPPLKISGFHNTQQQRNTIRVDSKVIAETNDLEGAKGDESRWMRFTLDTVGRREWPIDPQGRPVYPEAFEELATKLERPLHPPGRDIRCIVSVGMLTEGWDCNTVTHIVGLRPFMSQLLCEQVVGRGLRRMDYEPRDDGRFTEEVAMVFGVPFEVVQFKAGVGGGGIRQDRKHVRALPNRADLEIQFPRVEGYTQAIRNRVRVDWSRIARLRVDPFNIPPEVDMKAGLINNQGRPSLNGPGPRVEVTLREFRAKRRLQELVFDLAGALTRDYVRQEHCEAPAHVLFPQLLSIVRRFVDEKVLVDPPADKKDLFLSPYYGWTVERLLEEVQPDTAQGEAPEVPRYETSRPPGSTADVDYWTSKEVREVIHSHVNYVVADTARWEQSAAAIIDRHQATRAFVKNAGMGFFIPYVHNGQRHDYTPDFIIWLKTAVGVRHFLILETKGFDPLEEVKQAAAMRWVNAVNADGNYGHWQYAMVKRVAEVAAKIDEAWRAILA